MYYAYYCSSGGARLQSTSLIARYNGRYAAVSTSAGRTSSEDGVGMRWDRSALIGGATGGIGDGYGHGWGGVGGVGVPLFTLSKKRSKEAFERANFFAMGL